MRLLCALCIWLLMAVSLSPSWAEELSVDDCMMCHADLETELPDGAARDLSIDPEEYAASAHGKAELACVDCHRDIEELPHAEKLAKADCTFCHEETGEIYDKSVHGQVNVEGKPDEAAQCSSCHGSHNILPASDPQSSVHHQHLAETCIKCHEDEALIEKHDRMAGKEQIQSFVMSVHGRSSVEDVESQAATCNDCHGAHDIQAHETSSSKISRPRVVETCGQCHKEVVDVYYESVHGRLAREQNPDVPVCTDCHGEHEIQSPENRQSTVSRYNIAETCARCHEDPQIISKYQIPIAAPSRFYRESVHGKALLIDKNEEAAACQDCHGYHSILGGHDPESTVSRDRIPDTCGNCHRQIDEEYERSVHATAFERGVSESPVCTDCHGEHTILGHLDPNSPVYPTRLAKEVCGRCHDSLVINRKYDLPGARVSTYNESYHGLASRLRDTTVANCASCHGSHEILPHTDERSMIYPANLLKTCGGCHPGASSEFVEGLVHVTPTQKDHPILYWIRIVYIWLIVLTIGGMLLHNLVIIFRHVRDKYRRQQSTPYVIRFPTAAIAQHLLLTACFIVLAITGFSLSFPDSLFARILVEYLGWGETARSIVHRVAGVCLILTIAWHILTMLFFRHGRKELGALMLRPRDLINACRNVAYHVGLTKTKPRFDRFDYSEKLEYWALLWGSVIMALTGLLMWFPVKAAELLGLSKIWVDAATVIHYYEAWLATLAIVVWHFFFVIFHPEEYPMALSWLTGKLPVSSMEERHPLELDRLEKEGKIHRSREDASKESE